MFDDPAHPPEAVSVRPVVRSRERRGGYSPSPRSQWGGKPTFGGARADGEVALIPTFFFRVALPAASSMRLNFDVPAQLHDPVRGNAEELGRIQGEVAQEDEQPIPPCQKNE